MTDNPLDNESKVITTQDIEAIVLKVLATKQYVTAAQVRDIVDTSIAAQTRAVDNRFADLVTKIDGVRQLVVSLDEHQRNGEAATQRYVQNVSKLEGVVSSFQATLDRLINRLDSNDQDDTRRDKRLTRLEEVVIGEPVTPGITPLFKSVELLQASINAGFAELKQHTDARIAPIEAWTMSRRGWEQRVVGAVRFAAKHPKWLLLLGGSGLGAIAFEFLRAVGVIK